MYFTCTRRGTRIRKYNSFLSRNYVEIMAAMVSASNKRGRSATRSTGSRGTRRVSQSASRSVSRTGRVWGQRQWPLASGYASLLHDPFPSTMRNILRYSETINMDPGAGVPSHYLFKATSIFDPNATGVGHQPYGHDTLAGIYNHYEVEEAIITITNTSVGSNSIIGITVTDDGSVNSGYDNVREVKGTSFMVLGADTTPKTLRAVYRRKQTFPISASTSPAALYGANPIENIFFDVWAEGALPTQDPAAVSLVVNITFTVRSWELKDLGLS